MTDVVTRIEIIRDRSQDDDDASETIFLTFETHLELPFSSASFWALASFWKTTHYSLQRFC
jgi:hypothetical protein